LIFLVPRFASRTKAGYSPDHLALMDCFSGCWRGCHKYGSRILWPRDDPIQITTGRARSCARPRWSTRNDQFVYSSGEALWSLLTRRHSKQN
jgi:hypothetical protein